MALAGAGLILAVSPAWAATRLRMHDAGSGVCGYSAMDSALGPGSTTSVTNMAAGPATLQWTKTAGGTSLQWMSAPLVSAVTISGTVTLNTWASESGTGANAGVRATVHRYAASEQAAFITQAQGTELTTSISNRNFTASGYTATTFAAGDRIVVKWWICRGHEWRCTRHSIRQASLGGREPSESSVFPGTRGIPGHALVADRQCDGCGISDRLT